MSKIVGEMFRNKREKLGLSLRDLSEHADISFSQLSKIERGESPISKESFSKIAEALYLDEIEVVDIAKYLVDDYISSYKKMKDDHVREIASRYITNFEEKYKQELTLSETIFKWLIYNKIDSLDFSEMKSLSSELQDFFEVRLRTIQKERD
ncbi:helix-turn-helix domain-containing protein [Paenibacillus alvei]|uniref:helix-turn-helix domain-containing protein n=1 Tax=Paenibacillus alvei TaxID=44250 RepID=UPI0018CE8106|nr:helix-turn-helix transcriptional regulator [Paenibacillus alvei]MCY9577931.1 helix-turn-helix domain-containing protein [Paenibacillus alvei]MCY9587502.1 helix-turn-helix domain-containing protein [Paenibacillus alvei]